MEKYFRNKRKCLRIVLYGPESTGKTTLAESLAKYYKTIWVPEWARAYLQKKWDKKKETCSMKDLSVIIKKQIKSQKKNEKKANELMFCDTNFLVTKVWAKTHYDGYCPPEVNDLIKKEIYDLYLLTAIDIPWIKDDLRDSPHRRKEMFFAFEEELKKYNFPYIYLNGDFEKRMKTTINYLSKLLEK